MASLKEQAYDVIKERIMDATYQPNTFIDEKLLAQELGASRTPVREALIALSQEGYLQILPKRGILIMPFTYQDALDVFEVRELIEPWLIRHYGPALSKEELEEERRLILEDLENNPYQKPGMSMRHHPHTLLIDKCTNKNIQDMLNFVEQQVGRVPDSRRVGNSWGERDKDEIRAKHLKLVDLMLAGDFEGAAKEMEKHVQIARDQYMKFWFS